MTIYDLINDAENAIPVAPSGVGTRAVVVGNYPDSTKDQPYFRQGDELHDPGPYVAYAGQAARILGTALPHCCNGIVIHSEGPLGLTNALNMATKDHLRKVLGEQSKAILIVETDSPLVKVLEKLELGDAEKGELRAKCLMKWSANANLWMIRDDYTQWI